MVKIMADSTCDLSRELLERYEVSVIPLHIVLGDREYEDGAQITPDDIFKWADEHNTTPKTAAPSLERACETMRPFVQAGGEAVVFCISEDMSTTANVMRLAAEELGAAERVTVINSENLSTGIGLLVIEAAEMAKRGMSAREIEAGILKLRPLVRASFVVDTLTYLHRGGRCSSVAAMAGSVLKLHPKIVVEGGRMSAAKKYRGPIDSVIMAYARDLEPALKNARPERVFITHSGCERDTVEAVRGYLGSLGVFAEILETRAGGVISSHCGPGTLGVLFISKD